MIRTSVIVSILSPAARSGLETVREVGQDLAAVVRDEHQILDANAAPPAPVEARLERDHVADDELVADAAHARRLVDLEPDAVAEAVIEPFVLRLSLGRFDWVMWPRSS